MCDFPPSVANQPQHVSRTLLLSRKANNTLLVSRGSGENMDFGAAQLDSGISQIRAFDIGNLPGGRPYNYPSEGRLMGWGLRNSVGVAEHPVTGGIYSGMLLCIIRSFDFMGQY